MADCCIIQDSVPGTGDERTLAPPRAIGTSATRRRIAALVATVAVAATPAIAAAPAAAAATYAEPNIWKPDYKAARDYARARKGEIIAFSLRTEHHVWNHHETRTMPSASVVKAMILVAYLRRDDVRNRNLHSKEKDMLEAMIEQSDDNATNRAFGSVGYDGLNRLAKKVGMKHFKTDGHWGRSSIDAEDQSLFLLHIDSFMPERHRKYALHLMESITPSQRWGIGQVHPKGWKVHFKGGWGRGTGWVDHQVALLTRGSMRIGLAILTYHDPDHAYGKNTLKGLAKRLLSHLDDKSVVQ